MQAKLPAVTLPYFATEVADILVHAPKAFPHVRAQAPELVAHIDPESVEVIAQIIQAFVGPPRARVHEAMVARGP